MRKISFRAWNPTKECMYSPVGIEYDGQIILGKEYWLDDGVLMQFTGLKTNNQKIDL